MRYRAAGLRPASHAHIALCCMPALILTACVQEPVAWGDVSYRGSQLGDPDTRSAMLSANLPVVDGAAAHCLRSIRTASAGSDLFRAWWTSRADGGVVLSMQRSTDGGSTWQPRVTVETRDRGRRGCERPAPGMFYEPRRAYLHLLYFVE